MATLITSDGLIVNDTFWIIGEIIVGIAILGVLSAVITVIMTRQLSKSRSATEILGERYARGELTREQYQQMGQDLGMSASLPESLRTGSPNGLDLAASGSRSEK